MGTTNSGGRFGRRLGGVWQVIRQAAADWSDDQAAQMGAALAFYSVLSLAPLVVIARVDCVVVRGCAMAASHFLSQIQSMVGEQGAKAIEGMLQHADQPKTGTVAAVLGVVTLLFGASGVFAQLQTAMNAVWDVPAKKTSGIWHTIRSRFLSFGMVLGTGFLLLVSLLLSAAIAAVGQQIGNRWPAVEGFTHLGNEVATFLVMTLLFGMIFKFLPDTPVAWRDVWHGR